MFPKSYWPQFYWPQAYWPESSIIIIPEALCGELTFSYMTEIASMEVIPPC